MYELIGINRYIMECKSDIYKKNARRDNELIDTLWNVNRLMTLILDEIAAELIDTLWNVNEEDWKIKSATITRINRYIMECK